MSCRDIIFSVAHFCRIHLVLFCFVFVFLFISFVLYLFILHFFHCRVVLIPSLLRGGRMFHKIYICCLLLFLLLVPAPWSWFLVLEVLLQDNLHISLVRIPCIWMFLSTLPCFCFQINVNFHYMSIVSQRSYWHSSLSSVNTADTKC